MNSDVELIVNAINGLKDNGNVAKDYVLPVFLSLTSAYLGVAVAKMTFSHQEKVKSEVGKVNIINKYLMKVGEARQALIAIKYNYKNMTKKDFIERAFEVPYIIFDDRRIINDSYELSFMAAPEKNYVKKEYHESWENPLRVSMMIDNYNQIYNLLTKRNEIYIELMGILSSQMSVSEKVTEKDNGEERLYSIIGKERLLSFCDLTEKLISFTDDILFEVEDFMVNFAVAAKGKVNLKLIKKYSTLLQYAKSEYEITRAIEPDYKNIGEYLGVTTQEAKERYDHGYIRR